MEQQYFAARVRGLRKEKELSQEQMATALGVSVQAVSKWECAQSYPDLITLVALADYFGVSVDALLRPGCEAREDVSCVDMPNDGTLYIVQVRNGEILRKDQYDPDCPISLCTGEKNIGISVWGNAQIEGSVGGSVNAGGYVESGPIGGAVNARGYVECGPVGGYVSADGYVECGPVGGRVNAGGNVECGDVGGDVDAGGNVECGDVDGNVDAGGNIVCGNADGNVNAGGNVECGNVGGAASAGRDLSCGHVGGNVTVNGNLSCGDISGDVTVDGTINCGDVGGNVNMPNS